MKATKIAWATSTFNPWWGCQKVSPGCANCYAETFANRTGNRVWGADAPRRFFSDKHWAEPLRWNEQARGSGKPWRVFCASMADVFEDRRDLDAQRDRLWALIEATPALTWLLLTKRPDRIAALAPVRWGTNGEEFEDSTLWPRNAWIGTTAEDQTRADERLPELCLIPAPVRFVSYEPALGPVNFDPYLGLVEDLCYLAPKEARSRAIRRGSQFVDWLIVGGESGGGARPFDVAWARAAVAAGERWGVPVFVKQLGANVEDSGVFDPTWAGPDARRGDAKGGDPAEWPAGIRVQNFPVLA